MRLFSFVASRCQPTCVPQPTYTDCIAVDMQSLNQRGRVTTVIKSRRVYSSVVVTQTRRQTVRLPKLSAVIWLLTAQRPMADSKGRGAGAPALPLLAQNYFQIAAFFRVKGI